MSAIKHCDRHNGDFSVREEGWSDGRFTVHNRYGDGTPNDVTETLDFCAACTQIMRNVPGAIDPLTVKTHTAIENAKEKGYDPDYVKWLEDQAKKPLTGSFHD